MATDFSVKIDETGYSPLFVALAFGNGLQYRYCHFYKVHR